MRERWGDAYDQARNTDADDLWASHVVDKGAAVRILELEGEVVAVGALVPDGTDAGRLVRISVDARHRRRGLATAIVRSLVGVARDRGMARVVVATDIPWSDAVALYQACGFEEQGRDDTDVHLALAL